jgi:hypothetical protein
MLRSRRIPLRLISFSLAYILSLAVHAETQTDPLQLYKEAIQQAESKAAQTIFNQLDANATDPALNAASAQPLIRPSSPTNAEKAFSPPQVAETQTNIGQTKKNPWLKPNPWEAQAKVNPWANAPIPAPTPTNPISGSTPPNIFLPPAKMSSANQ